MSENYYEKLSEILRINMTERGFGLWKAIDEKLPTIWEKSTSSSFKYHKRADGTVPNIAEHTYEMVYSAIPLLSMFAINVNTADADVILLALAFHDSLKYGSAGDREHTTGTHDKLAADMVKTNRAIFLQILSEDQVNILEESVRYHSGRWSTDATDSFSFSERNPIAMMVHMLDMLSTKDLLKFN
jgi:hypothetical protein